MRKKCTILLLLLLLIGVSNPAEVKAENVEEGRYCSGETIVDFSDLQDGDTLILYEDEETGLVLSVDILSPESIIGTQAASGNTGWSGGYIPSDTTVLYPHLNNPTTLYVVVGCYLSINLNSSVKINSVYNPVITTLGLTVNGLNYSVNNSVATSTNPARATMNWVAVMTEGGITIGSESNYFTVEINTLKQARITWRLSL